MPPPPPSFQLFTSLRYDPLLLTSAENSRPDLNFIIPSPFYMLAYHRDRMVEAALHFDFDAVTAALSDGPALHRDLLERVKTWQTQEGKEDGPLKLRVLFNAAGQMTVDFLAIPPVPLSTLYPPSFDIPRSTSTSTSASTLHTHPAKQPSQPSPLPNSALNLNPTSSLPAGDSSQSTQPPQPQSFTPSSLTGGALQLGNGVTLPAGNQDPNWHPPSPPQDPSPPSPPPPPAPAQQQAQQPPTWLLRLDSHPTPPSPFTLLKTTLRAPYDASRARALPSNPHSPVHAEVILFNAVREVTEGSLTSLYFFRGGRWVTPPVGVPGGFERGLQDGGDGEGSGDEEGEEGGGKAPLSPDEGELRAPFAGRWGHSVRSAKVAGGIGSGGQRGTSRRWALGKGFCMEEPVDVGTVAEGETVWVSNGVRGFGVGRVVGRGD